jgi:anti-sigma factor (TIGR02949 family)
MNVVNFNERACERYRRYFDSYLDNELLVETNQDVLQHLNACTECTRILETRARVKQLVKNAVTAQSAPPELVTAVRAQLHTERPGFFGFNTARWMMAAAAVLLVAIVGIGTLQWTRGEQFSGDDGVFQTVSDRVQDILRVGLVDHVHCVILAQQWKRFVSFEEMKANTRPSALGPEFIDLVPVLESKLGSQFKLTLGHRCVVNKREYIHFILTGDKGILLSLVITKKKSTETVNESFAQADAEAVVRASGIPIYREHQGILEVAGFESDKYLAYIVSNLDRDKNLNVASALAPVVYDHLHKLEI